MEITFNKVGDVYISEFKAEGDFNLRILRPEAGAISFYQRTAETGEFAHVDAAGNQNYNLVFDADFTALIWPKYMKIVSDVQPTSAVVTYNA